MKPERPTILNGPTRIHTKDSTLVSPMAKFQFPLGIQLLHIRETLPSWPSVPSRVEGRGLQRSGPEVASEMAIEAGEILCCLALVVCLRVAGETMKYS